MSVKWLWNAYAKIYHKLWVQKFSLAPTRQAVLESASDSIAEELKVLDVGCGVGELLADMHHHYPAYGLELYGVDYAEKMIEVAALNCPTAKYRVLDVSDLASHYEEIDMIVNTHSFPYYSDQPQVLKDFNQVLSEKGQAIVAFASANTWYDHFIMFFFFFSTGKANYMSDQSFQASCEGLFTIKRQQWIKERPFMPAIVMYHLEKQGETL